MKELWKTVGAKLKNNTAEKFTVRFFSALFLVCTVFLAVAYPVEFDSYKFFDKVGILPFIAAFILSYAVLSVVFTFFDSIKTERLLLLLSYTAYALFCIAETDSIWFGVGACLLLLVICVYVFKDGKAPALRRDVPRWVMIAAVAAAGLYFAVHIGIQTVCRYMTQSTPNYDFGIFSQMFYYMKTTLLPLATCERDMLLSHFSVHLSPAFYLFLPFYAIFPSPATLMVCQSVTIATVVIPVAFICKKFGLTNKAESAFALIYALYPALAGGCFYDLHENKLLPPLLLWLFYFILKNKWYGIASFSVLVMLVKEDAAVYVAFAGVYVLFTAVKKDKFKGLFMLLLSVAYFVGAAYLLNAFGEGTMDYRFGNFMSSQNDSLLTVISNIIKDPAYAVHQIFDNAADISVETKTEFMLRMFIPLGFLPLMTKKPSRYILLLPLVLINLMSDYVYQHSIFFQYTYGPMAFLIFAAIMNYSELKDKTMRTVCTFAVIASTFICMQTVWQKNDYLKSYLADKEGYDAILSAVDSVPEEGSVSASTFCCAAASRRKELYQLEYTEHKFDVDYIIIDLRTPAGRESLKDYEHNPLFTVFRKVEGRLIIFQRTE